MQSATFLLVRAAIWTSSLRRSDLKDSAVAIPTTPWKRVLAFVKQFLRDRAGLQEPFPKPSFKKPSVVDQDLVTKHLIDDAFNGGS